MKFQAYTDPMGTLNRTLDSLYDFIPAIRRQRTRGLLESPVVTKSTGQDLSYLLPPESGGHGDWGGSGNSGWGDVGLPVSNTDMGIPATIGPAQALGNVVGLLGLPGIAAVSLPASLAMQQKGIDPVNSLFGFNPVSQLANAFGLGSSPSSGGFGIGDIGISSDGFGYGGVVGGIGANPGTVNGLSDWGNDALGVGDFGIGEGFGMGDFGDGGLAGTEGTGGGDF